MSKRTRAIMKHILTDMHGKQKAVIEGEIPYIRRMNVYLTMPDGNPKDMGKIILVEIDFNSPEPKYDGVLDERKYTILESDEDSMKSVPLQINDDILHYQKMWDDFEGKNRLTVTSI